MVTSQIYRVTIRGRKLESRNLRDLLARAVSEKRSIDRRLRICPGAGRSGLMTGSALSGTAMAG